MLTVKINSPNGDEEIIECVRVEYCHDGRLLPDGSKQFDRGLLCHYENDAYLHIGETEVVSLREYKQKRVFVMNRFGATVATYLL